MSLRMLLLLSVLAVAMATPDDVTRLDNDVIPRDVYPGLGEYFFIGAPVNWTKAVLACHEIDAHLLVIDSDAERSAVREMMTKYDVTYIHLGFSDQWTEGSYYDVLDNSISSACIAGSQWAPANPKGGATYNCGGFGADGFEDARCGDSSSFICEKNQPSQGAQLSGYTLIENHGYYKYHTNRMNWTAAHDICGSEGTHLVVLNSQEEVEALRTTFTLAYSFYYHVGIHRFYGGNTNFLTVAGEPLESTGYTKWYGSSEPSFDFITRPYTYFLGGSSTLYGLASLLPTTTYPFICEHELS